LLHQKIAREFSQRKINFFSENHCVIYFSPNSLFEQPGVEKQWYCNI
jgi:hypothetical protein